MPEISKDESLYTALLGEKSTTLVITPSTVADVKVNCLSRKEISLGYEVMAYCAAQFLFTARGLPSDSVDIETPEKIYTVCKDLKSGKITFDLPKCKQLYANKSEIVDGIQLKVSARSYKDRIFKLIRCADAEHFADASLRSVLRSGIEDSFDGVAAYSLKEGALRVRYLLSARGALSDTIYILSAVATSVFEGEGRSDTLKVKTDNLSVTFRVSGDSLALCDDKSEVYTLFAPDNNFI